MHINDEHEQDNPAVTTLIEMLISKKITGALLFAAVPANVADTSKKKVAKAVKETAAMASLEGDEDEDDWDTDEKEGPPGVLEVAQIVRREFLEYLGERVEVLTFVTGHVTMRLAFAATAHRFVPKSREFELGEMISRVFDLRKNINLMEFQNHTFAQFCAALTKLAHDAYKKEKSFRFGKSDTKTKSMVKKAGKMTKSQVENLLGLNVIPAAVAQAKKKAARLKAEQPAYDNSHNHGFRGRINQRTIDSMQSKKTAPHDQSDLKDEDW